MMRGPGTPLCAALLLVLTAAAYSPVWNNGFVDFDDELYLTTNPQVTRGLTWPGFAWAWTNHHGRYWMPLTWLSYQLDAQVFPTWSADGRRIPSPAAVHGQNLFWHTASVLLLFGWLLRLTGARGCSFLVAALFAVHPMHVESVAWAAERKDVLSVCLGILALWAYTRYAEKPGWKRYLPLGAAFLLSLLSKPMLMTLPFVLLLLDYWPLRRTASPGRLVLEKAPLFVLAAGVGVLTLAARQQAGSVVSWHVLPLSARLANAAAAYGWYVGTTFYPTRLAALYPHPYRDWPLLPTLGGTATLLAGTLLAVWQARRRPWFLVGWLWFVGALLPVIGLAQGGEQAWADRFSYWPHIGLFIALASALGEVVERRHIPAWAAAAAGAALLGCLAALTWVQAGAWHDTATLWNRVLAVTRDNDVAHVHLGYYYLHRDQLDEAESHFAEAVRIHPDSAEYHFFLGAVLLPLGKVEEAAGHLRAAVERDPNNGDACYNLGLARLRLEQPEAAACCFRRALELRPDWADARAGLGLALWRGGRRQEALEELRSAVRQQPGQAEAWHGLGVAALVQGHPGEAVAAFDRALQANPQLVRAQSDLGVAFGRQGQWARAAAAQRTAVQLQDQGGDALEKGTGPAPGPEAVPEGVLFRCRLGQALYQLGDRQAAAAAYRAAFRRDPDWPRKFLARAWSLATDPDGDRRDPLLARDLASEVVQAADEPTASMLEVLAASEAAQGDFPEATRAARQALQKAEAAGETSQATAIRDHLRLYEQG